MSDKKTGAAAPEPAAPSAVPAYVLLLDDYGAHIAGRVLKGDLDLLAELDRGGVRWRAASDAERGLAGLPAL